MVASDVLAIERLDRGDVIAGLALSDDAGWNQTADDWALFIERGRAIGCRDPSGRLIATAAALPYGSGVGWVSMVLVADGFRHRGLATSLLGECVETLRAAGRVPVLDATSAGAEVYRQSGFAAGFGFERWQGAGSAIDARDEPASDRQRDVAVAADAAATGVDRGFVLRAFLARPATRAWLAPDGQGFAIARAGRRATQIGPIVAANETQASDLLDAALAACAGRVFIDVPSRWSSLAAGLEQRGFARQRPFLRMALGRTPVLEASQRVFAVAGPEFG